MTTTMTTTMMMMRTSKGGEKTFYFREGGGLRELDEGGMITKKTRDGSTAAFGGFSFRF